MGLDFRIGGAFTLHHDNARLIFFLAGPKAIPIGLTGGQRLKVLFYLSRHNIELVLGVLFASGVASVIKFEVGSKYLKLVRMEGYPYLYTGSSRDFK